MALWCVCLSIFPIPRFFLFPPWIAFSFFFLFPFRSSRLILMNSHIWTSILVIYSCHMHLVRIHVKSRPQHGPHLPPDPNDPTAVAIRRGYELPTKSEPVTRWGSALWRSFPFVSQVSSMELDSISISPIIETKISNIGQSSHDTNSYWDWHQIFSDIDWFPSP